MSRRPSLHRRSRQGRLSGLARSPISCGYTGFRDDREFVTVEAKGATFVIVDIAMRMVTPRELYNAQGFPPDCVLAGAHDYQEDGLGPVWRLFSKFVQVNCVGNSVSPPVACALVSANCGYLAVQRGAA
ncbi:hypothetical protein ASD03_31480 [Ensifer sp. Root127]|nr:hypothetical protein ASD03_31480 [Ensifer sp. Root127]